MPEVITALLKIPVDLNARLEAVRERENQKKHGFILQLIDERLTEKEFEYFRSRPASNGPGYPVKEA